jgi:predicted amidophosphoribosyltransferase
VSRCAECSGRRLAFAVARAAIAYDERARALVRAWKERGRRQLAPMLASLVTGAVGRPDVDALVWVPGDRERTRYRGHLPSRGLALALGVDWGLPAVGLLERSGGASRQAGLTLAARRHNVRGVFRARSRPPPRICLVDDVYTTGSTAHACAAAVRRAGGSYVEVVCLARAVR